MTLLPGIADLERRLNLVVEGCRRTDNVEAASKTKPSEKDTFVVLKTELLELMGRVRELLEERKKLGKHEKSGSSSSQYVKLSVRSRTLIEQCRARTMHLRQVLREQCARANAVGLRLSARLSERELDRRYDQLSAIGEFLETCSKCMKDSSQVPNFPPELSDSDTDVRSARKKLFDDGVSHTSLRESRHRDSLEAHRAPSHRIGEFSPEEGEAMEEWTMRMDDIDQDIDDIDVMVDRLREVAVEIGEAGKRHSELIERIRQRNEDVDGGIRAVSERVRKIVFTENKSAMTCRIILGLLLLVMAGWIYTRVKD